MRNTWDASWPRFWRSRCEALLRSAPALRPTWRRLMQVRQFSWAPYATVGYEELGVAL